MKHTPCEIVSSPRASERIRAAATFLEKLPAGTEALVIGASREAADDLVRGVSMRSGATFGIHRLTLNRLAGLLASDHLNLNALAPAAGLAIEAITARVVHRLKGTGALEYFDPVIARPGFPRALARTISELRLNRIMPNKLKGKGGAADALANAIDEFAAELDAAKLADRASILIAAAKSLQAKDAPRFAGIPCVMLDVAIETVLEAELVEALALRAPAFLATIPAGDQVTQIIPGARAQNGNHLARGPRRTRADFIAKVAGSSVPERARGIRSRRHRHGGIGAGRDARGGGNRAAHSG